MWVSRQRFAELEKRVNELDLENIRKKIEEGKRELEEAIKGISRLVNTAVDEKTKDFSHRFHAIQGRLSEQEKKVDLIQKTVQKSLSWISDLIKEISVLVGEKPKKGNGS